MRTQQVNDDHVSALACSLVVECQGRHPPGPPDPQSYVANGATRYCRSLGVNGPCSAFWEWRRHGSSRGVVTGRLASGCVGDARTGLRSMFRLLRVGRRERREGDDSHNSKSSSAATIAMNTYVETFMRRAQLDSTEVSTNTSEQ